MEQAKPPIFIVGSGRSGTTLLRLLLDSHPNISCGPETRFLIELRKFYDRASRVEGYGYDEQYWIYAIADLFDRFHADYMRSRGKVRWADKTPAYALHLDFIHRLFPGAQIVHIIRDARDVVASYKDRWGYRSALRSIRTWRRAVSAARRFGQKVPERYFELHYERLVSDTEVTMRSLLEFLGEPWDPIVLDYTKAEHDAADSHAALTEKRRADAGQSAVVYSSRVGVGKKELDPILRTLCLGVNRGLLKELGYL